ncbi:MAG TPA: hypothetical protein VGI39_43280 [Polyangiaceae bacterium]|jgi:hypothetical protein
MASRKGAVIALGALFLVTSANCGLFLGDQKKGLCDFGASTTSCGECLAISCTAALGDCCGSPTCRVALDALGTCSSAGACGATFSTAGAPDLASCLETTCATRCAGNGTDSGLAADASLPSPGPDGGDATAGNDASIAADGAGGDASGADAQAGKDAAPDGATSGADASSAIYTTTCSKEGTAGCTCDAPDPKNPGAANSTACNLTAVPGSVCCADQGWPQAGTTCACLTATCDHPAGGGCDCSLGTDGQTCNDGVVCCATGSPLECLCTYGVSTCWEGYRQVQQCDAPAIGCGSQNSVTSCSLAAN